MMNISDLIRDTIISLCRANGPYNGHVEIDGIICISGPKEGQQMVIKVHERLEGFVKESVETWINKKTIHEDVNNRWSPQTKSENLSSSRFPSISEGERTGIVSEACLGFEGKNIIEMTNCLTGDISLHASTDSTVVEKGFIDTKGCLSPSLECKLCLKSFLDQESMEVHNELCHNLFTCHSCLKTFTSRSNLERHSRLHTGHKPYTCTICDKAFSRKDHLSNHMSKHAFKCNSCSKKFGDCLSLASHFSYDHRSSLTHICQMCNEGFSNSVAYEDHLSSHSECQNFNLDKISSSIINGQKKFSCHLCSFCSTDALVFYRHRLSHMFDNRSQYSCILCNKPFDNLKSFMEHSMEHQNSMASQTLHINWLQHFSNHYQSLLMTGNTEAHHNSAVNQLSEVRKKEFFQKNRNHSLKDLVDFEHSERKMKRKQEHPSTFDVGIKLQKVCDNISPPSPGVIPSSFSKLKNVSLSSRHLSESINSLTDHYNSNEDSIFESSPINLKMEKVSESEDHVSGPHQCGMCQRWFNSFEGLDNHCLEEHNRSACMFCSKTFAQRANRDRHLCLHTGKKPYSCTDCDEKFSRGDKLKMHRIKVHGAIYPSRIKDTDTNSWLGGNLLMNQNFHLDLSPDGDVFEDNSTHFKSDDHQSNIVTEDSKTQNVDENALDIPEEQI